MQKPFMSFKHSLLGLSAITLVLAGPVYAQQAAPGSPSTAADANGNNSSASGSPITSRPATRASGSMSINSATNINPVTGGTLGSTGGSMGGAPSGPMGASSGSSPTPLSSSATGAGATSSGSIGASGSTSGSSSSSH